ncbi:hypothetical protein I4U23_022827 [Adineta vaga]|nr:hypothetical protein I4U23_022827 [Adineta vaga]
MEKMNGIGGLKNWQWLYLLEGLPIIPLGIFTYLFLDNVPNAVQWLNNIEKQLLTNLLRNDIGIADGNPELNNRLSWRQVQYVFTDWRIYIYGLIAIGNETVILCLTTFFPTLIKTAGYSHTETHLLPVPCYILACLCCLLINYSSSQRNEHGYHIIFCLFISLIGFILILTLFKHGKIAIYISMSITFCGVLSSFPLLLSWLTNNIGGHTKRVTAISFVIGTAQIGGIITPFIYRDIDKPIYRRGHLICSGLIIISMILTIFLRIYLLRENHRRIQLSDEIYNQEANMREPCDRHPDIRYVL